MHLLLQRQRHPGTFAAAQAVHLPIRGGVRPSHHGLVPGQRPEARLALELHHLHHGGPPAHVPPQVGTAQALSPDEPAAALWRPAGRGNPPNGVLRCNDHGVTGKRGGSVHFRAHRLVFHRPLRGPGRGVHIPDLQVLLLPDLLLLLPSPRHRRVRPSRGPFARGASVPAPLWRRSPLWRRGMIRGETRWRVGEREREREREKERERMLKG
mmetsp:Transcript_20907/g.47152  ORF Transcript_20907/g.47152 Transcript_20907/m.47152 type:complete len:211 (-) Transcript_20907:53-685(-)